MNDHAIGSCTMSIRRVNRRTYSFVYAVSYTLFVFGLATPIHVKLASSAPVSKTPSSAPLPTSSSTPILSNETTSKSTNTFSLARCLALADLYNTSIRMAQARLTQAHAQLDEIRWLPWSQFSLTGGVAYVPELRGTNVYSPNDDISFSSARSGIGWRVNAEGVIPLYTFGKISNANAAAAAGVNVAEHDIAVIRNQIHHEIRRAFFGLQLVRDIRYVLNQANEKINEAIQNAEKDAKIDETDRIRLKMTRAEIEARYGEAEKSEREALAGLRFLTGIQPNQNLEIPDLPLKKPEKPLLDVASYLSIARAHRPELRQVRAGMQAREAQVDLAKSRMFPDLGLGLSLGYSNAPVITNQTNPFVTDNANYLRYGAGVVFRWNLDIMPNAARIRQAQAQLNELEDKERYALGGIRFEVEKAYGFVRDAAMREKAYADAARFANGWLVAVSTAISIGTKEEKDLIDPLRARLLNKFNHLQALMDYKLALSTLSLATGDESIVGTY